MNTNGLLPTILHTTISGLTNGGTFGLGNGEKIENPFETPVLLDEMRVHATGQLIDYLRMHLQYGQQDLCNDYLPLDLFGKTLNWEGQHVRVAGAGNDIFAAHVWRFPKPILLPPGFRLTPRIKYQDDYGANPVTTAQIHLTFAGRRLPKGTPLPTRIDIPYIASFHAPLPDTTAVNGTPFVSTESDLKNPFPEMLNIERLLFALHTANGAEDALYGSSGTGIDAALTTVAIRMHDSLGAIVLRDTAAIGDVIAPLDRSWPLSTQLRPGAYYIVDGEVTNSFDEMAVWFALHGTRNVALAAIGG